MEVKIDGIPTEDVIEKEYSKGRGNMNLPPSKNIAREFYEKGLKARPNMTEEEKKKLWTQCQLATDKEEMSQLVDRLQSGNFQG